MVEKGDNVSLSAFLDKLKNQIARGGRVHSIVIVQTSGIVKREAVVMTGGDAYIFASRRLCNTYDLRHAYGIEMLL
jgi:hypothetical protein